MIFWFVFLESGSDDLLRERRGRGYIRVVIGTKFFGGLHTDVLFVPILTIVDAGDAIELPLSLVFVTLVFTVREE